MAPCTWAPSCRSLRVHLFVATRRRVMWGTSITRNSRPVTRGEIRDSQVGLVSAPKEKINLYPISCPQSSKKLTYDAALGGGVVHNPHTSVTALGEIGDRFIFSPSVERERRLLSRKKISPQLGTSTDRFRTTRPDAVIPHTRGIPRPRNAG